MAWDNNASEYSQHVANYRNELDEYTTGLTNIIKEIKKDDSNIDVSNFSHIESAIRSIKGSRKRWAMGDSLIVYSEGQSAYATYYMTPPKLSFIPQIIVFNVLVNTRNLSVIPFIFDFSKRKFTRAFFIGEHSRDPKGEISIVDTLTIDKQGGYFLLNQSGGMNIGGVSVTSWYAFE